LGNPQQPLYNNLIQPNLPQQPMIIRPQLLPQQPNNIIQNPQYFQNIPPQQNTPIYPYQNSLNNPLQFNPYLQPNQLPPMTMRQLKYLNGGSCSGGFCADYPAGQTPKVGQNCTDDLMLADGFYCLNGTATASHPLGDTCSGVSNFECLHGYCNFSGKCDTYLNSYLSYNHPAVEQGNAYGVLSCVDSSNCTYNVSGVSISAQKLGFSCLPTLYAPTYQYFCQLGGGEPIFRHIVDYVRFSLLNYLK
jgi:hypothetical protein